MALEDYLLTAAIISGIILIFWFFLLFRMATLLEEIRGDTKKIMELLEGFTGQMEKKER